MKRATLTKSIFLILSVFLLVMFVVENLDPVPLYVPFLKARHTGMMYIILGAYILGAVTAFIMMRNMGAKIRKGKEVDESEELFDEE